MPISTPNITDSNTEIPIKALVCMPLSHIPVKPQNKRVNITNNPRRNPATFIVGNTKNRMTANQGDSIKKSSIEIYQALITPATARVTHL